MRIRWAAESSISVSTALESVDVTVQTALMGKKKADEVTTGDNKPEVRHKEELTFDNVHLATCSYK